MKLDNVRVRRINAFHLFLSIALKVSVIDHPPRIYLYLGQSVARSVHSQLFRTPFLRPEGIAVFTKTRHLTLT
jgi:hypothetical protein